MRVIFNHLLAHVLHLGGERLTLMASLHRLITKYSKQIEQRRMIERDVLTLARKNRKLRHRIGDVLEAIEKSKPDILTSEQECMVELAKRFFRTSTEDYKQILSLAYELKLHEDLIDELKVEELPTKK